MSEIGKVKKLTNFYTLYIDNPSVTFFLNFLTLSKDQFEEDNKVTFELAQKMNDFQVGWFSDNTLSNLHSVETLSEIKEEREYNGLCLKR